MTSNRIIIVSLACLFAIAGPQNLAFADTLLSKADGSWSGGGWFKNGVDAPKEAARCRYKNKAGSAGNELKISGKCSMAGRTFQTSGTISSAARSGSFTGSWSNPRGPGKISLVGQKSGSRITFTFRAREETSAKYLPHRSVWTISGAKLRLVGSVKHPETGKFTEISVMEFTR